MESSRCPSKCQYDSNTTQMCTNCLLIEMQSHCLNDLKCLRQFVKQVCMYCHCWLMGPYASSQSIAVHQTQWAATFSHVVATKVLQVVASLSVHPYGKHALYVSQFVGLLLHSASVLRTGLTAQIWSLSSCTCKDQTHHCCTCKNYCKTFLAELLHTSVQSTDFMHIHTFLALHQDCLCWMPRHRKWKCILSSLPCIRSNDANVFGREERLRIFACWENIFLCHILLFGCTIGLICIPIIIIIILNNTK